MKHSMSNTTDTSRPHLECPKCGKTVTSLKEWRTVSRWPKTYTCPYCQYRYTIPFQIMQLYIFAGVGIFCLLLYLCIIEPWLIELLSVGSIAQKIILGVVMICSLFVGDRVGRKFGEKMAYKHPLQ